MLVNDLVRFLDQRTAAEPWLRTLGLENVDRAHANFVRLAEAGVTLDLLAHLGGQLQQHLPEVSDPDMALNNLERFMLAQRSPLGFAALLERDPDTLPSLLRLFATSQYLSDQLVRDPESLDLLRITEGQPVAREALVREIVSEIETVADERTALNILRRWKHRETVRIAFGDIIRQQRLETVTAQISYLADALVEGAIVAARRDLSRRRGSPKLADGRPARFVALALGKLGGGELNYSSDIDLVFLCDGDGQTDGPQPVSNREYFERLATKIVKLLSENTEWGAAYRVDLRLRPDGQQGPLVVTLESALHYYDVYGRTWERQAYVKARPIAGDLDLGREFLERLTPWIYRRYLSRADISGIKALKRRIEQRAQREEADQRNLKTGHGGIRDIEFVIQFLQLLNGGDLPDVRTGHTLDAIAALENVGCLTFQERSLLEENYTFLRKAEHLLQIMLDVQTHSLPNDDDELRRLARRLGYRDQPNRPALEAFRSDLRTKTEVNRKILDHLLHDAFADDAATEPETDLVLDPDPPAAEIEAILGRHRFQDIRAAHANLMALTHEKISFLSTRRCRHFLAAIAPKLLRAIATTPDPDATLVTLGKVSDSIGGKGVLWELFSFNTPSLQLYVQLCAASPYLAGILMSNPGMIDELMDSLLLDKLPTLRQLQQTLADLCRGAEDLDPILHSFKHSQHLRIGVRELLGKEDLRYTHRALSDVADVCLHQIAQGEYAKLAEKHGTPRVGSDGRPCELIILAMGKLGGREPNYHSDLDVVFLYEAEGTTQSRRPDRSTTNQHFFSQLGQRIIKVVTQLGPHGRLYELDARLRPTGKSGSLVLSVGELERYFTSGQGQLWERQALCKARTVFASEHACNLVMETVRRILTNPPWQPSFAADIRHMRQRLEATATKRNLKRGPGGTVDIEFLVQMLQLQHAREHPEVLVPGTFDALSALQASNLLSADDAQYLQRSYRFLRSVEAGLRLMNTAARHDLPEDELELRKLAYLLGQPSGALLQEDCVRFTTENRARFERIFDRAHAG